MASDNVGFAEILTQLKILNRLVAAQLRATLSQQDLVRLLSSTGATNQEVANVLDTTPATVSTTLQRLKKKAGRRAPRDAESGARSADLARGEEI